MAEEKKGADRFGTVALSEDGRSLVIIDQTLLPGEMKYIALSDQRDIREAIYRLKVRGAPAIVVAAAIALYLAALEISESAPQADEDEFFRRLEAAKIYLQESRPTAVNLKWALDRMYRHALSLKGAGAARIAASMRLEAEKIRSEDVDVCRRIGENGLTLLKKGQGILTHCNAGRLACVRYGTATAPIYLGHERGYDFRVFADETRPLLQGARLTSYELSEAGIDVTLICDNMASSVMQKGWIDAVITGCDRVAANGDTANKIGTSGVAILAHHYGIPFYIAAPSSTIDFETETGAGIVIEERSGDEIRKMWYREPMAPETVRTYNPAFDVTDASLISGIITEYGVLRAPYDVSLKELRDKIEAEKRKEGDL